MSRRSWVALVALAALFTLTASIPGASERAGAESALEPPTDQQVPTGPVASDGAGVPPRTTGPGPGGAAVADPAPAAPPHVQPFATGLAADPQPPLPSPTAPVALPEGADGCDHAYGEPGQCVPWQLPASVTDACQWLRGQGFGSLSVHGRDRHGLDTNGDGIACGPGD